MSTISNCQFYCLSFNNEEKRKDMEKKFKELDISCEFYDGVKHTDKRLANAGTKFNKRHWSITYGHLDIINKFYYHSEQKYAIICEDDILIHKHFKKIFQKIITDFNILELDILLLGYIIPYKIGYHNIFSNYTLKRKMPLDSAFKYHDYPDYLSGSHMYMITRKFARYILKKYYTDSAALINKPFMIDKTIIKEGNRALIYPMIAIENDTQEDEYHELCHKIHYNEMYI